MREGTLVRGAEPRKSRRAGWTILEILISTVILLILLMGFSYGLVSSTSLGKATREQGTAREAARGLLEELRGTAFEQALALYTAAEERNFDVPGLDARPDDRRRSPPGNSPDGESRRIRP